MRATIHLISILQKEHEKMKITSYLGNHVSCRIHCFMDFPCTYCPWEHSYLSRNTFWLVINRAQSPELHYERIITSYCYILYTAQMGSLPFRCCGNLPHSAMFTRYVYLRVRCSECNPVGVVTCLAISRTFQKLKMIFY